MKIYNHGPMARWPMWVHHVLNRTSFDRYFAWKFYWVHWVFALGLGIACWPPSDYRGLAFLGASYLLFRCTWIYLAIQWVDKNDRWKN